MNRKELKKFFNEISPSDDQKQKMLSKILNHEEGELVMTRRKNRVSIIAAAVMLCIFTTTIVLAATNSNFQNLLIKLNPIYKDYINPIEKSCIANGIKMEVVAIGAYNNQVKAYITLQDLEGNRIDETSILSVDIQPDNIYPAVDTYIVDYDKETGILTYFINIESDFPIEGETITINIYKIRSYPKSSEEETTVYEEIKGNWQVTADVDAKKDIIELNEQIEIDGLVIDKIVITPFGATFSGSKFTYDVKEFDVKVHEKEEVIQLEWISLTTHDNGEYKAIIFEGGKPINTEALTSISINGREISIFLSH